MWHIQGIKFTGVPCPSDFYLTAAGSAKHATWGVRTILSPLALSRTKPQGFHRRGGEGGFRLFP